MGIFGGDFGDAMNVSEDFDPFAGGGFAQNMPVFGANINTGDGGVSTDSEAMAQSIAAAENIPVEQKEKDSFVSKLIGRGIDLLTLSSGVGAIANTVSKIATGETIGTHIVSLFSKAFSDSIFSGGSVQAAKQAGQSAAQSAIDLEIKNGGIDGADGQKLMEGFNSERFNSGITQMAITTSNNLGIPSNIMPGLTDYVTKSEQVTGDYTARADSLWDDYLNFEKTYFDKYQGVQDEYKSNIEGIPGLDLTLPETMGGATIPLAPKVHSSMYGTQARTMGDLVGSQANIGLAGMGSRDALSKNMFNVGQTGLTNALLPTQTALDLYKMERAGELGINQIEAGMPEGPSTLEKWAPVVGSLLSTNDSGDTNLESAWDFVSDFFN